MKRALAGLALLGMLAGCSSSAGSPAPAPSTPASADAPNSVATSPTSATSVTPTAVATKASSAATMTAVTMVARFKTAGLSVGAMHGYTAADDPNHLLGRPNGYTAKESWVDTRVKASDIAGEGKWSVDGGGSVEQFATHADAEERSSYIEGILKADVALGSEYDYVTGDLLIRVSGYLTPAQAKQYKSAAA